MTAVSAGLYAEVVSVIWEELDLIFLQKNKNLMFLATK